MPPQEPATGAATSWRDHAVARSLDPARARAEKRVQRFLDAALELLNTPDAKDFTVQQVVERSGQSLRSFYQYFAGKHELLLALFEESLRNTADHLAQAIERVDDPMERLRIVLGEYYRLCAVAPKDKSAGRKRPPNPAAIAEFAQQLLSEHPNEAAEAFKPLVSLMEGVLDDAAAAGALRQDLNHRRLAGVLLNEIMFNVFSSTISGSSDHDHSPEDFWDLVLHGIAAR